MGTNIQYLSPPAPVSMGDRWFYVSTVEHFWVQRRFDVLRKMAGGILQSARKLAEIGCGHGLVQLQVERFYKKQITGFDLNEIALKRNVSNMSPVCCYDVFHQLPEYKATFDSILLFDVLEHLPDEDAFLKAVQFHLAPNGKILINLPAFPFLWSQYDVSQGHYRRYTIDSLKKVVERNGMRISNWTYWGLPLVPVLLLRKLMIAMLRGEKATQAGFEAGSALVNKTLALLARLEVIPQRLVGTSVMAVLEWKK